MVSQTNTIVQEQATLAQRVWRDAVATVAEKARITLPDAGARIEAATQLVLSGDVELLPDGTARVASQRPGAPSYHLNGVCDCKAATTHPDKNYWCVHRLAYSIAKRATSLARQGGVCPGRAGRRHAGGGRTRHRHASGQRGTCPATICRDDQRHAIYYLRRTPRTEVTRPWQPA